jgi:hypothetical protein
MLTVLPLNRPSWLHDNLAQEHFAKLQLRLVAEWRDVLVNLVRDRLGQHFDLFQRDPVQVRHILRFWGVRWRDRERCESFRSMNQ